MKRFVSLICLLVITTALFGSNSFAKEEHQLKVAFIRDNDLWIKVGQNEERRVTDGEFIRHPKWSYDGNWLAFSKGEAERELWVYDLKSNNIQRVYDSIHQFQWSPIETKLAFLSNGVLNVTDVTKMKEQKFENIALGIGRFSWKPNGKEFLVSSMANLLPTGWTSVELFTVPVGANLNPEKMRHFFSLPKQSDEFFAVMTSPFQWSDDGKWISFLGIPTASISMDMNTLCVISDDGKVFQQLGKMLSFDDWFQWAPHSNRLAFIEGEGRFAVKNKHLMVNEFPVHQGLSLTPAGYVEKGFTWIDGVQIIVSRAKESEWKNDPKQRPKPSLYHINILTKHQTAITSLENGEGDYMPFYLPNSKKLAWVHAGEDYTGTIFVSDLDGKHKQALVKDVGDGTLYEDSNSWSKIISYFD
ncbi:PD40 domain-containing protein [Anaerobacillus isosaccharinicus]|uniref:PD40 domain-containing protein n=1 Tax=Anaerobacillus isosaccharinicus TaxID=1532552 RepID=A0A1S2L692_9BACI|nr:PD40 domain-containing protein [Anaerobacillus isosaccharinicus]MBA5584994.1 PD40 domain-containing protein [Anaerobacillus isosaccharinicus]QOY36652.1 PD40 domain-containing protein [Anaerobacillus isosaccharinicus]